MEFEDIELTPQNYEVPARPRNQDLYFTVSKKLFQEVHIFFQIVNVETDKGYFGLIMEDINIQKDTYLKYHSSYYMNNYIEEDIYESEKPFSNITIKLHDQIRIQKRTYPKIIAIFGDVGGFMDLILILLKFLSFFPINILYEKEIVNKLFKFDFENHYIYVKKFEKSKMPIDFIELYNNDFFNHTDSHVDEKEIRKKNYFLPNLIDKLKGKANKKNNNTNFYDNKTEKIENKNNITNSYDKSN